MICFMEVGEIASQIYISRSFQVYMYIIIYIYIYCIYTVFIFFIGLAKKATLWGGELQPSAYKGDIYLKTLRFDSEILQKKTTT